MTHASTRQLSWLDRLLATDNFQLTLISYAILYGAMALGLEHVAGIIGFSKTPYLNGAGYVFGLGVIAFAFIANRVTIGFFNINPLIMLILISLFASTVIGFSNDNPSAYIVAWNVYILTGIGLFSLFRHPNGPNLGNLDRIFSPAFLLFLLSMGLLSVFNRDNHYQYILTEVIALYAILLRPRMVEKAMGFLLYAIVHLGSASGFVQVEINRASILSLLVVGLIFLVYRRYFITIFFIAVTAVAGLFYALSLDKETVEMLPRNISEAIMLMKGDDIYNHVSTYQRVYEGERVMADFQDATAIEDIFGKGLGRTVDMTGAADRSVGQHAYLGVTAVHNIHFIHFAILHKFGIFGLGLFTLLAFGIVFMLMRDLASGRLDDTLIFFYFYVLYTLIFAIPASNHLIGNPLWPVFLGTLCYLRKRPRGDYRADPGKNR